MSIDYQDVIAVESARFAAAVVAAGVGAGVPSCPDWTAADLIWHLSEVQYFWASIVDGLLDDPASVTDLERPKDEDLAALFDEQSRYLLASLAARDDDEICWSWGHDRTVGFVRRRQAHEAAIHRVDAELAAGRPITPLDDDLATDGIAELFEHMLGPPPEWATFTPDETHVQIVTTGGRSWLGVHGRFRGTSPNSGTTHDLADFQLVDHAASADAVVSGTADALDRWLWGRGDLAELIVTGDHAAVERLRATLAESTR